MTELRFLDQGEDGVYEIYQDPTPVFSSQAFVHLEDLGSYKTAKGKFRAGDGKVRTKPIIIQDLGHGVIHTYIRTADVRKR